jgi:hypothetical protein
MVLAVRDAKSDVMEYFKDNTGIQGIADGESTHAHLPRLQLMLVALQNFAEEQAKTEEALVPFKTEIDKLREHIKLLSQAILDNAAAKTVASALAPGKKPSFTKHESIRLLHVIADPDNLTALSNSVKKVERAELDAGIHDPWNEDDGEFTTSFNSAKKEYSHVKPHEQFLFDLDPNNHPEQRGGEHLKNTYTKLRSDFTVCFSKWEASGQNDPDRL